VLSEAAGRPCIAIVVPFRPQREQDRAAQLEAFICHMAGFAVSASARFVVVVAQQSADGRKFNRGQLLNAGYREAQRAASPDRLASVVLHDLDLLPERSLLSWYVAPPALHAPVHLAGSGWGKYDMPGYDFFGGVTAFHPDDVSDISCIPGEARFLAFTRDSFTLRLSCTNQSSLYCVPPPALPRLLQYYCTAIAQ